MIKADIDRMEGNDTGVSQPGALRRAHPEPAPKETSHKESSETLCQITGLYKMSVSWRADRRAVLEEGRAEETGQLNAVYRSWIITIKDVSGNSVKYELHL